MICYNIQPLIPPPIGITSMATGSSLEEVNILFQMHKVNFFSGSLFQSMSRDVNFWHVDRMEKGMSAFKIVTDKPTFRKTQA